MLTTAEGRLQALLSDVAAAGTAETVTIGDMLERVGRRSYGAMLLFPSLIVVSPLSGIPGAPSTAALIIILVCVQYLMGRDTVWLPRPILDVRVPRRRLEWALRRTRPLVRVVDRWVRPRLTVLINRFTFSVITAICALLAATMPPSEVLPFAATITASIIALFALALLVRDGLLALFAFVLTGGAVAAFLIFVVPELLKIFG
ncbi:exopolysaccharide biosynthesis protein [Acuticoccus mangrovi]|uniref:Exopolysaccharide biosynthesis protein n=1 Tax=Acuticoccus mangrovi TaxID=2796142 RepID=A0A934MIW4_9HYPH|nr:exopolysaccharide biosynthesis protein [Acuticoccus mangrovi]MBJ3778315.1 exopolysaccharide biosynthesis protein [Acuticoccus mangrovi]